MHPIFILFFIFTLFELCILVCNLEENLKLLPSVIFYFSMLFCVINWYEFYFNFCKMQLILFSSSFSIVKFFIILHLNIIEFLKYSKLLIIVFSVTSKICNLLFKWVVLSIPCSINSLNIYQRSFKWNPENYSMIYDKKVGKKFIYWLTICIEFVLYMVCK